MATVRLNDAGFKNAVLQIESGAPVDGISEAAQHLGIKTGADRSWAYNVFEGGSVSRAALLTARATASHLGHTAIVDAAGELLSLIDGDEAPTAMANVLTAGLEASAVQLEAKDWGELPEGLVQLFPFGPKTLNDGRFFEVTEWSLMSVAELFARKNNPIAIDYDHDTFSDKPFKSLASGWIWEVWAVPPSVEVADATDLKTVQLIADQFGQDQADRVNTYGPGIYAWVRWTENAWAKIQGREYVFLSPVFKFDPETGEVSELKSAGLTNYPAYDGMMPVAASENLDNPAQSGNVDLGIDRKPSEKPDENDGGHDMKWETLAGQMGITADTEEEFIAKASALRGSSDGMATAEARVKELEQEKLVNEATALVDKAIADRFLVAEQREAFIALATEDRTRYDVIMSTMVAAPEPEPVKKPPQGKETTTAKATEKTGAISLNFSPTGKHKVTSEQMALAEEFVAKAKEAGGGNTAKGIRDHSSVILPHLTG